MVFFLPFWAVYSRGVSGGGRLFAQLTTCREDLSNKPFSRECWGSPYFAFAQYGLLVALFRFRSIRALGRPISLSLNTGSGSGYVLGPGPLRAYASAGRGYVLGLWPLRAYACGSSSIARWGIRRANADWERPGGRLSN